MKILKTIFSRPQQTLLLAGYGLIVLVLILLSASNYPVQWKIQVNHERQRYLAVIAQALRYYAADHDGGVPDLPSELSMIANTQSCSAYCPALSKQIPCYDLAKTLVPGYMKELLQDPLNSSQEESGFYLKYIDKHLTLGACHVFFGQTVTADEAL
jgi:hypothetical protein